MKKKSMTGKILTLLSPADKRGLLGLLIFTIGISIMETVGISAIMPFISVASNYDLVETNKWFHKVYAMLQFDSAAQFVMTFGLCLIGFYIFRGITNLIYMYMMNRYSQGLAYKLAMKLFGNYIHLNYRDFIKQDTADLTKKLVTEMQFMATFFNALLMLLSESFIVVFIYGILLLVDFKITLVLTGFLLFKAVVFLRTITKRMAKEGDRRNDSQNAYYKVISESLRNLKIIRLTSSEPVLQKQFSEAGYGYMRSTVMSASLSHVPRLSLESVGFSILIGIIVYVIWAKGNPALVIPTISMYAIALYRMLPSVNRIMSSYNNMQFYKQSLNLVYNDFILPTETYGDGPLSFDSKVEIKNLSFAYDSKKVLKDLNLTINKGDRIALIGPSGSGKSTIADILIGMYSNFDGTISVDGTKVDDSNLKSWRKIVGYIPQSMFLFDSTAGENVAFGRQYDEKRVGEALSKADLKDFLDTKEGSQTPVGESGVMLSGGQKQRIAIARALYGNPPILVLDEATSALDNATESRIMDHLYSMNEDTTLIVIAHRLSTIRACNKIYKVDNGTITPVTDINLYEQELTKTQPGACDA